MLPNPTRRKCVSVIERIAAAMRARDPNDPTLFTRDGRPRVDVIERELGHDITTEQRDRAWRLLIDRGEAAIARKIGDLHVRH
jgi:hypothetical protein